MNGRLIEAEHRVIGIQLILLDFESLPALLVLLALHPGLEECDVLRIRQERVGQPGQQLGHFLRGLALGLRIDYNSELAILYMVQALVDHFELLKLLFESLQSLLVFQIDVVDADDIVLSLLEARLDLRLEVVLAKRAVDVRVALEVEESSGVQLSKALEELLVAAEVLLVDFDIEALLDLLQLVQGFLGRVEVVPGELVQLLFFGFLGVDDGQADHGVQLARQVVQLRPRLKLLAQQRHPLP